jgi:glycerol-3-phosphate dehydrogenase
MRLPPLPDEVDVLVVGGGVVGCAIAALLSRGSLDVLLIEQRDDICEGTSKANTAILHTGFDCVPGSLESQLVARGFHLLDEYARGAGIALERTGALVVAWDAPQRDSLIELLEKARSNGYTAARIIDADEVRAREPFLGPGAQGALEIPDESIIDPWSPVLAFALEALNGGAEIAFGSELLGVGRRGTVRQVTTSRGEVRCRWLINAAGLSADLIDVECGHGDFQITPRRGELLVYDKSARPLVDSIILPVPTTTTKGVVVTPTVFGNLLVGPTADDLEDRSATATTELGIERLRATGRRLVPQLGAHEITASYAGLRAATESRDFQIHLHPGEGYICVGGIRSTGLTASMAIAEHVADLLVADGCSGAGRRRSPQPPAMPPLGERQERPSQDPVRIAENPSYGRILCHCELVSAGELHDACGGPLGARSLGGIRRRTRAMNGRCQAFYCGATVLSLLAELSGRSVAELTGLEP